MSKPSLSPIYQQLNGINEYHPFAADTFADWASEAGDTVTISRDGKSYKSPITKQTIKWHGKQMVSMESAGQKERTPIEKMSNRKYASGGGGRSYARSISEKTFMFEANIDHLLYAVEDPENGLAAKLEMTAERLTLDYIRRIEESNTELYGAIEVTADHLTSDYIQRIGSSNTELRGVITQTASSLTSDYTQIIGNKDIELRGVITQTASSLTSDYTMKIGSSNTELRGVITQTASSLTSDYTARIWSKDIELRGVITQTASSLTSDYTQRIGSSNTELRGVITQTASSLTSDYSAKIGSSNTELRGVITQTASSLTSDYIAKIGSSNTELRGVITQTASSLTSDYTQKIGNKDTELRGVISQTASSLTSDYTQKIGSKDTELRGVINQTASSLTSDYTTKIGSSNTELRGVINQTASSLTVDYTEKIDYVDTGLRGKFIVESGKVAAIVSAKDARTVQSYKSRSDFPATGVDYYIYLDTSTGSYYVWDGRRYVSSTGPGASINAGNITLAINTAGESVAHIDANKIYIGDQKSTTVINGKLNASDLTSDRINSLIGGIAQLTVNGLNVAGNLYIRNGGGLQQNVGAGIWDLNIAKSGDTYTLQRKRFSDSAWVDVGSFSRATSLGGAWSGGELTVSATPQGNTFKASLFTGGHWGYASGESPTTYYGTISARHNDGSTSYTTGAYFEVDASGLAPSVSGLGIYDGDNAKRSGDITLGWSGSVSLQARYTTDGGATWVSGDTFIVRGQALPRITNVNRKSSGISGTSVGNVSGLTGSYVTFSMGGSNYYIRIE